MLIEINSSEFHDRIRKFDSCSLSYDGAHALFEWIETQIAEGTLADEAVCIGTWAIASSEMTLEEIQSDHGDGETALEDWDDVREAISWDGLGDCYSDCIELDDDRAVMIGIV